MCRCLLPEAWSGSGDRVSSEGRRDSAVEVEGGAPEVAALEEPCDGSGGAVWSMRRSADLWGAVLDECGYHEHNRHE